MILVEISFPFMLVFLQEAAKWCYPTYLIKMYQFFFLSLSFKMFFFFFFFFFFHMFTIYTDDDYSI